MGLAVAPATAAQEAKAPPRAEIPFANSGGVWDWTTGDDDRTIYFQDRHRQWYKATLFMQAFDLPYTTAIRIDSGPTNTLDKWGAIYVGRQRYPFQSFEVVDGPPKKAKKAKTDKAAKAN
ncbi:MAG: hypothetical protein J7485_13810 [Sphingobium sp.]|nr:hypothetical protein [Sphingobium sp.]